MYVSIILLAVKSILSLSTEQLALVVAGFSLVVVGMSLLIVMKVLETTKPKEGD